MIRDWNLRSLGQRRAIVAVFGERDLVAHGLRIQAAMIGYERGVVLTPRALAELRAADAELGF